MPLVAFLSPRTFAGNIDAFRRGLREFGYVEGQNITLEVRSADGDNRRLPALAAELAALKPDVIVTNSEPAIRAVKEVPAPSRSSCRSSATRWLSALRKAWHTRAAI